MILSPPKEGWKQGTMYLVEVAWNANNPIHRAVFYSGFLDNGRPGSYSYFCCSSYVKHAWEELYYMKVLRVLATYDEVHLSGIHLVEDRINGL